MSDKPARFEEIVAHGNRYFHGDHTGERDGQPNWITCRDGFGLSVTAGQGSMCTPQPALCVHDDDEYDSEREGLFPGELPCTYSGPYTHVEVMAHVPTWDLEPGHDVYARVPVEEVRELIDRHGGEA